MLKVTEIEKFDDVVEAHLARYIANRNKRTGKKWSVVRRYKTQTVVGNGSGWQPYEYNRAYVAAPDTKPVRIYYPPWARFETDAACWKRA